MSTETYFNAALAFEDAAHVPLWAASGCDSCDTCFRHDGCADDDNPVDLARGDCAECGACGGCVADCLKARETENDDYPRPTTPAAQP